MFDCTFSCIGKCWLPSIRQGAAGWKFRVAMLDSDLEIHAVNGVARIVQDGLENTHDACIETACTFKR